MFTVLLIGAGQIGSRHLQGLAKVDNKINIIVVEPTLEAVKGAKHLWMEAGGDKSKHRIEWISGLGKKKLDVDLVIVATSSFGRASLIKEIASRENPKYWVIEKVLAQSKEEIDQIKSDTKKAKGAWVNIARRVDEWHKKIKSNFSNKGPLRVTKSGNLWGLACNTIHFIDLVAWWTGEALVSIDIKDLKPTWFEGKRVGYFEIEGEMIANFSNGTELVLQSYPDKLENIIKVELLNKEVWAIDEDTGIASTSTGTILKGRIQYQSELTGPMVDKIIEFSKCELPSVKESSEQHKIFLDVMLQHWNESQSLNDKRIPIT